MTDPYKPRLGSKPVSSVRGVFVMRGKRGEGHLFGPSYSTGSIRCCGCKGDSIRAARARKRSAEEEPADNRVSVWIGVGHPDSGMAAQIPNKVLAAGEPGNHASVQQAVVRIKDVDLLGAAAAISVPIEHVKGDLMQTGVSEIHIDGEYVAGIPACRDAVGGRRCFLHGPGFAGGAVPHVKTV